MVEEEQLTRFERARIIGARALQIARGAPILIKTEETNTIKISEAEFAAGVIPLKVRHKLPPKQ